MNDSEHVPWAQGVQSYSSSFGGEQDLDLAEDTTSGAASILHEGGGEAEEEVVGDEHLTSSASGENPVFMAAGFTSPLGSWPGVDTSLLGGVSSSSMTVGEEYQAMASQKARGKERVSPSRDLTRGAAGEVGSLWVSCLTIESSP